MPTTNITIREIITLKNLFKCAMKRISLQRCTQNHFCSLLSLDGDVLDLGSDGGSAYLDFFQTKDLRSIRHVNLYSNNEGVLKIDLEKKWKLPDEESSDTVCMMNTLEHIYNYNTTLLGAYNSLNDGGTIIGSVPFLYKVHGVPFDYHRYTDTALNAALSEAGFIGIEIFSISSGRWSAASSIAAREIKFKPLGFLFYVIALFLDKISADATKNEYPINYFFKAKKPDGVKK